MAPPRTADELRQAFVDFFVSKQHSAVASASLIPHDPTLLFTVAGMVPFKPYFVGDEVPPYKRAVSVQKCARAGGKHNDLDEVGRTTRHLVFFEMLGNFSFGDYFKAEAIPWSWELVTEVFGFDGDRLWVTVHESDDEAEQIWHDVVGVPMERIQRLGDADNFWQMGETGPCGPCSEIHIDRGPAYGPDGGPLNDPGGDRFLEFWNLVFMQYNQAPDGSRERLPQPSIDTGAGLERILTLVQGVDSIWESDVMSPIIEEARRVTGAAYVPGDYADRDSFSLRVLAEHARSATMLVSDGVFPSNENRGYVLRRIIRRAVRHAFLLGTETLVLPRLVETAIGVMGNAYPDVRDNKDFVLGVVTKEEERFRQTLRNGLSILEDELSGGGKLSGSTAFLLHDTYGFPLELTEEITAERGVEVDTAGFADHMAEQRRRARSARKVADDGEKAAAYRDVLESHGTTEFVGYARDTAEAQIVAVLEDGEGRYEVFLDRTPFYAESGGQVGDTGTIFGEGVELEVLDTTFALPELRSHLCVARAGVPAPGMAVTAGIDVARRQATRRNHTGTHILHWALRQVLGAHVKQAGSLVGPDRLRFDFSHYGAVSAEEITAIEELANAEVLANADVEIWEAEKEEALAAGAIAFFGDKYGDRVRVLRAGSSVELCGGTHVSATGDIGTIKILAESSVGSNLRRIEATTGVRTLEVMRKTEDQLAEIARLVGANGPDVAGAVARRIEDLETQGEELRRLRAEIGRQMAGRLAADAVQGIVVARVDGEEPSALRDLVVAVRQQPEIRAAVLGGTTPSGGVSFAAAVRAGTAVSAGELIADAARLAGGGGGGKGDVATAGGKKPEMIDAALDVARDKARELLS